jgi:hypothetical protein
LAEAEDRHQHRNDRCERRALEDVDPHPEHVADRADPPHEHADADADHERERHADGERMQRDPDRALELAGRQHGRAGRHDARKRRYQDDEIEPADQFPQREPDQQRGHHRDAAAHDRHARRLSPGDSA